MIRFACPSCQSVLLGRDDQAGKIVACPKCGQRLEAPRPAISVRQTKSISPRKSRTPPSKASGRPRVLGIVLIGALLLASAAGGIWIWTRSFHAEAEPSIAARATPSPLPVADASGAPRTKPETRKPQADKNKPVETKPPPDKPPNVKPSSDENAPPPPPVEEKKEIELADDRPPELSFDLVDAINVHREKAGREPIYLDAELSNGCQSRAEHLARNVGRLGDKDVSAKQATECVAAEAPLAAIEKWMRQPARRAAILEPRLRTFGAGFARNVAGQWVSVFDWTGGLDRQPPLETTPIKGAIVYPVPAQSRVPLWFPGNETPDPLPDAVNKLAGFPITLTFPPRSRLETVTAHLRDADERDIDVWLSSPEKPANPRFANAQQHTICLIAKKPLRPNTRYRIEVSATVNGEPWSAKWGFTTVSAGEIHHELAGKLLRTLNGLRRRAGLPPVPFDAECSKACAAHARYLGLNTATHPMLDWNAEQKNLAGYTEEGAAAARSAA
ncbi:MAG: CAP domain-containing protein, partial [Gemmataceae bacterium]